MMYSIIYSDISACLSMVRSYLVIQVKILFIAYRKCGQRIFKLQYQTHCDILNVLMNSMSIDCMLEKGFLSFS